MSLSATATSSIYFTAQKRSGNFEDFVTRSLSFRPAGESWSVLKDALIRDFISHSLFSMPVLNDSWRVCKSQVSISSKCGDPLSFL